jgi:hypothetical protein
VEESLNRLQKLQGLNFDMSNSTRLTETLRRHENHRPPMFPFPSRRLPRGLTAFLVFLLPVCAASLKKETTDVWEEYIQAANIRIRDGVNLGKPFLWADQSPDRVAKVRGGEIIVSPVGPNIPKEIPSGLIHDWVGAVFIANTNFEQVLPVLRDYGSYKDFYQPGVIASKPLTLSDAEDRFTMLLANKSLFRKIAFDSDYRSSQFQVNDRRRYTIAQTTRIQEIAEYGTASQHTLPADEGTGLVWRLVSVTRFEARDGGVYIEIEAIVLSRDIPGSLSWLVKPMVRRVAKASLTNTLQQTRDAVLNSTLSSRAAAIRR